MVIVVTRCHRHEQLDSVQVDPTPEQSITGRPTAEEQLDSMISVATKRPSKCDTFIVSTLTQQVDKNKNTGVGRSVVWLNARWSHNVVPA